MWVINCVSRYTQKLFGRSHCFYHPIRVLKKQSFSVVYIFYRDNLGIKAEDVKGYFVPEFLMKKMKLWMKRKNIYRLLNQQSILLPFTKSNKCCELQENCSFIKFGYYVALIVVQQKLYKHKKLVCYLQGAVLIIR